MNRLSVSFVILALLLTGRGFAQTPSAEEFLKQAITLQKHLDEWRQDVSDMRFSSLPVSEDKLLLLRQDRSACLRRLATAESDVREVEGRATLERQLRLSLDVIRLQGDLTNLEEAFSEITGEPQPPMFAAIDMQLPSSSGGLGYEIFKELKALNASSQAGRPGEISGRVYRADIGKPLADARVMLGLASSIGAPLRTVQTGPDGNYTFSGVPPGQYYAGAYLKGFTRGHYGPTGRYGASWSTINLASGQDLSGIDMKLHPLVSVTQMDERALFEANPVEEVGFRGCRGSLAPDGTLFAFVLSVSGGHQAWLYDLTSRRLTPITPKPGQVGVTEASVIGWVGDTVYVKEFLLGGGLIHFFAATKDGTKEISQLPPALQHATPVVTGSDRYVDVGARNNRFIVSAVHQTCYHCAGLNLTVRGAEGGKPYVIAGGSWELDSFILEPARSLVIYPTEGFPNAIITYDLNTRQRRLGYLPNGAQRLLAATPGNGGFVVAYTSNGPCLGYDTGMSLYPYPASRFRAPDDVCFARIPFEAKQ